MSIYATWLCLDGDDHDVDRCAAYYDSGDRIFEFTGKPCDCGAAKKSQPIIYKGSHVLPSDDDPRGGHVFVCAIPDHITRDGRDDAPEGALKDWLRLSVDADGASYHGGAQAEVVLDRPLVEQLRDTLTHWLEAKERA